MQVACGDRRTRVHWTSDEFRTVAGGIVAIRRVRPEISNVQAFLMAQDRLPEHRRRTVTAWVKVAGELDPILHELAPDLPPPPRRGRYRVVANFRRTPPAPPPPPPPSTDDLVKSLAEAMRQEWEARLSEYKPPILPAPDPNPSRDQVLASLGLPELLTLLLPKLLSHFHEQQRVLDRVDKELTLLTAKLYRQSVNEAVVAEIVDGTPNPHQPVADHNGNGHHVKRPATPKVAVVALTGGNQRVLKDRYGSRVRFTFLDVDQISRGVSPDHDHFFLCVKFANHSWLRIFRTFPDSKVHYVNGGMSALCKEIDKRVFGVK